MGATRNLGRASLHLVPFRLVLVLEASATACSRRVDDPLSRDAARIFATVDPGTQNVAIGLPWDWARQGIALRRHPEDVEFPAFSVSDKSDGAVQLKGNRL